ncbi:MAG: GNAT family N-acetyltransferase [Micrococcales bacterium]|nr:GNAT family N-acetyltransferase [Micrococcales bacterium]MCL2666659.1 GNAT family N-acetyltransferase [Micrococcales bacterium]
MSQPATEFVTELLTSAHQIDEFDSGEDETDSWLRSSAVRAQQQGSARTRVLVRAGERRVLGFYALTPHDTHREDLPSSAAGGLRVVPGYLIAQLAVDRSLQGQGMGAELLLDALETIVSASGAVGGRLVVVDAVHENTLGFYERFGFIRIGASLRLYMKISKITGSLPWPGQQRAAPPW